MTQLASLLPAMTTCLKAVLLKHFFRFLLRDLDSLEDLGFLCNGFHLRRDVGPLVWCQSATAFAHEAIIVETLFNNWTNGQIDAIELLQRLAQDVRGAVPEGLHQIRAIYQ
jgi:hypothetical protein